MEPNKLFHFFRGLTTPSPDKWSSHFSKLVRQLTKAVLETKRNKEMTKKNLLQKDLSIENSLNMLEPYVKRIKFKNHQEDTPKARADLLALWEILLKLLLETDKVNLQTKSYRLISSIMTRHEFSLNNLDFSKPSLAAKFKYYKLETIKKYENLLVDTLIYVWGSISLKNGNLVETLQFCANVLAVTFFRFNIVKKLIFDALQRKKVKNEKNSYIFDKNKRRSVIKTLRARQRIDEIKKSLFTKQVEPSKPACVTSDESVEEPSSHVLTPIQETPLQPIFDKGSEEVASKMPVLDAASQSQSGFHSRLHPRWSTRNRKGMQRSLFLKTFLRKTLKGKQSETNLLQVEKFVQATPDLFLWWTLTDKSTAEVRLQEFLEKVKLDQIPESISWLEEKETFYVTFINSYVSFVNTTSSVDVEWKEIPGYDMILDCFWPLMKSYFVWQNTAEMQPERALGFIRTVTASNYVDNCYRLLLRSDGSFVNELIYLCLCETNVLSYKSVVVSLDKIKAFIEYVGGTHFQVEIYWFGISNCLKQENVNITRKVILHLFETLNIMKGDERLAFCIHLFQNFFYKLFLHWSPEIRLLFQAMLVFKVFRTDRRKLPCSADASLFTLSETIQSKKFCKVPVLSQRNEPKDEDRISDSQFEEREIDTKLAVFIDGLVFNCISCHRGEEDGATKIPINLQPYLSIGLKTYTQILGKFFNNEPHDTTAQILKSLLSLLEAIGGSQQMDDGTID